MIYLKEGKNEYPVAVITSKQSVYKDNFTLINLVRMPILYKLHLCNSFEIPKHP